MALMSPPWKCIFSDNLWRCSHMLCQNDSIVNFRNFQNGCDIDILVCVNRNVHRRLSMPSMEPIEIATFWDFGWRFSSNITKFTTAQNVELFFNLMTSSMASNSSTELSTGMLTCLPYTCTSCILMISIILCSYQLWGAIQSFQNLYGLFDLWKWHNTWMSPRASWPSVVTNEHGCMPSHHPSLDGLSLHYH